MEKLAAPRGTADVYPPQSARWQALEARIHRVARRFGYGEIRTPTFEATELFERGVGGDTDIVEKEMYTFDDRGGRRLTLRPEMTAPVVRAMLQHNLLAQGPVRLYYVGPFFRYERPQKGRFREAHQFGVECFGQEGPAADVEVIHIAAELLREYGVATTLEINSIGDAACRGTYRAALLDHFRPLAQALSADSVRRLEHNPLRVLDSKAPEDREAIESAPRVVDHLCAPCAAHFAGVRALLEAIGLEYRVTPRIVRGLDYYTRTVFEFASDALGSQAAVCGGGRYDELVQSLGGPPTPGVGFGLGLERFLMVVEAAGAQSETQREGIAVIALGSAARERLVPLVAELRRRADVPVTIDYGDARIGAQLKRADRANARAAVIAGDQEIAGGKLELRDLALRAQQTLDAGGGWEQTASAILDWYATLPAALASRLAEQAG
jgi:histidyl-tRNA synthetase